MDSNTGGSQKIEQSLMQDLLHEYMKERKRKHRRSFILKALLLILLGYLAYQIFNVYYQQPAWKASPHAALIDIRGPIFDTAKSSADNIAKALSEAYKDKGTKAILLRINSPGGSPVQADNVYNMVTRLREKHPKIKVYAICTDICASAAYYIAASADKIYANPSSLVGSIGVLYNGFGFVDSLQKLGIERRLVTAGKYKGFLDPFSPTNATEETYLKTMLNIIHKQFENNVKRGRGTRLVQDPDIFSGLFWTGVQAKQRGLIDDYGSAGYVARKIVKTKKIVDYTVEPNYLEKIVKQFGAGISDHLVTKLGIDSSQIIR